MNSEVDFISATRHS